LCRITKFARISNSEGMGRIGRKFFDFFWLPAFVTNLRNHGFSVAYGSVIPCL
jgi:hypothetical protein